MINLNLFHQAKLKLKLRSNKLDFKLKLFNWQLSSEIIAVVDENVSKEWLVGSSSEWTSWLDPGSFLARWLEPKLGSLGLENF